MPDRLAAQLRHLPAAGGPVQPQPRRHPGRAAVPHDPGRAGGVRGAAARRPVGPARRPAGSGLPAGHPGPAGGGGVRGRGLGRGRPAGPGPPGRPVRGPVRGRLRRGRRDGVRRHPDRPRPPGGLPAPGPGDRAAGRPAGGPPGRAHLRRGHPRAGGLPGAGRAGRQPGRHGERGLGDRVHGGRRVPARHHLVADPPGRAGRGARRRRAGCAAVGAVLAGRGPRPHGGAVGGGLRPPQGGGRAAWATAARPRPRPGCRPNAGSAGMPRR